MTDSKVLLSAEAIERALIRIAHEIAERNLDSRSLVILGIQRGGVHLGARLGKLLEGIWQHPVPAGFLDVNMHRDDIGQKLAPEIHPTNVPMDITGKTVILVDDVLCSGRTTRAALDALTSLGRPASIQLAVLVDRGHRQLPIRADFVGKAVLTTRDERIDVLLREEGGNELVLLRRS